MSMDCRIKLPRQAIEEYCRRWKIVRLEFFGSVLRDDFGPESDIDLLVSFDPDNRWSLLDLVEMEQELGKVLGRKVDLVERSSIEKSPNWIRRQDILSTAREYYAA